MDRSRQGRPERWRDRSFSAIAGCRSLLQILGVRRSPLTGRSRVSTRDSRGRPCLEGRHLVRRESRWSPCPRWGGLRRHLGDDGRVQGRELDRLGTRSEGVRARGHNGTQDRPQRRLPRGHPAGAAYDDSVDPQVGYQLLAAEALQLRT
jgi:hypothetical protein